MSTQVVLTGNKGFTQESIPFDALGAKALIVGVYSGDAYTATTDGVLNVYVGGSLPPENIGARFTLEAMSVSLPSAKGPWGVPVQLVKLDLETNDLPLSTGLGLNFSVSGGPFTGSFYYWVIAVS